MTKNHESMCFQMVIPHIAAALQTLFRSARLPLLAAFLGLAIILGPQAWAQDTLDRIVATVNGQIITLFELNQRLRPLMERFKGHELSAQEKQQLEQARQAVLNNLIEDVLLEQEAKRLNIPVSDAEVTNQIETIKKRNNLDADRFAQELKLRAMSEAEFRDMVRRDILTHRLLGAMVRRKVVVTTEEIERYYNEHKADFSKGRQVDLSLILLPPGIPAEDVLDTIRQGKMTFSQAAEAYSRGPGAESGGRVGALNWNDLAPEWREALSGLSEGEMSEPFRVGQAGQAILLLNKSIPGDSRTLDESSEEIREILVKPLYEANYNEYVQRLRSKALIDIKL